MEVLKPYGQWGEPPAPSELRGLAKWAADLWEVLKAGEVSGASMTALEAELDSQRHRVWHSKAPLLNHILAQAEEHLYHLPSPDGWSPDLYARYLPLAIAAVTPAAVEIYRAAGLAVTPAAGAAVTPAAGAAVTPAAADICGADSRLICVLAVTYCADKFSPASDVAYFQLLTQVTAHAAMDIAEACLAAHAARAARAAHGPLLEPVPDCEGCMRHFRDATDDPDAFIAHVGSSSCESRMEEGTPIPTVVWRVVRIAYAKGFRSNFRKLCLFAALAAPAKRGWIQQVAGRTVILLPPEVSIDMCWDAIASAAAGYIAILENKFELACTWITTAASTPVFPLQ